MTLGCSELLATRVAMVVHGNDNQVDLTLSRIEQAVGKVTDLVANDVMKLIGGPCVLSPPIVCEGLEVIPIATLPIAQVAFACYSQPLIITLVERQAVM